MSIHLLGTPGTADLVTMTIWLILSRIVHGKLLKPERGGMSVSKNEMAPDLRSRVTKSLTSQSWGAELRQMRAFSQCSNGQPDANDPLELVVMATETLQANVNMASWVSHAMWALR